MENSQITFQSCGIPKGSILGPVLFKATSMVSRCRHKFSTTMFTDDSN